MRPRRLEIEGFTSFKEALVLDFEGLDLFAITGPTGAGKSSLIDAMVFALYGQVPRVGREYKQLISHGAERMSVKLDFEVGAKRYRVARTARLSGNPQTVLEQETPKGFEPLAGRVKDIEERVQKIVGLDYEAFTRSVVLPQGQFDAFLKGEPRERHKILIALLNLDVYVEMQRIAHRRSADAKREADFIGTQLTSDFKEATPEVLATRQKELAEAQRARVRGEAALAAVGDGLNVARQVTAARREAASARHDLETQTSAAQHALTTMAEAGDRRKALASERSEIEKKLGAVRFDPVRHQKLLGARPRAEQLVDLLPQRERLARARQDQKAALDKATSRAAQAEAALPDLAKGHAESASGLAKARAEREALHRRHAAVELRRKLAPGDPCPVCEQRVGIVPKGAAPDLDRAEASVRKAEKQEAAARQVMEDGRLLAERVRGERERAAEQGTELTAQEKDLERQTRALSEALESTGFGPLERADPKALLAALSSEMNRLEKTRGEKERLEGEQRKVEGALARLDTEVAAAGGQLEAARKRVAELEARREQVRADLERGEKGLRAQAKANAWELGPDEEASLQALQRAFQKEHADAAATAGRLETLAARLEKDIAQAALYTQKKADLEARAAVAHTLAQHLRADQLLAYVQEEALRLLAEDGSRHLEALSLGRYSLVARDQEFAVVDHWNADSQRSVKTLSGGETFLASLALALALAEGLAALAVEGHAGEALESLFLDEGFGTLDPETLGQVVQALDALHGGRRLVGVVTHIPELAAQLPARVEVERVLGTARISLS